MKKALFFWVPTVLLLFPMVGSGIYYFVDTPAVALIFTELGYPSYTLYFNAVAKMLGGLVIVLPIFPRWIKEFAYAGYLYIMLLALQAIWLMQPGGQWLMFGFLALWAWAYWAFRMYKA